MERDLFLAAMIKNSVQNLENKIDFPRFGVSGVGGSSPSLTRLWDSVGKTAQVGTDGDNTAVVNDFDGYAPFNRRKCVGSWGVVGGKPCFTPQAYQGDADYTEDGSKGDYVCVDVRPFYWYESADKSVIGVSAGKQQGWSIHPVCVEKATGNVREHTYLPCYALAKKNGKAVSLPGLRNECGNYKGLWDAARTYDSDAAAFAILEPSDVDHYEWLLQTIEFATTNSNSVMYGALSMRWAATDTFDCITPTTGVVPAACGGAYVIGQNVYIGASYGAAVYATHKLTAKAKCDADGTPNENGSYYLLTVEAYDDTPALTPATQYQTASRPWSTGACSGVSTPSGSPVSNSSGLYPCRYRWRENPWGNQAMTCVDLMNKRIGNESDGYTLEWYHLPDPMSYYPTSTSKPDAADLDADWTLLAVTQETYADGYIKKEDADPLYPHVRIPVNTQDASTGTFFCDYAYLVSGTAVRSVRRRGLLSYGANGGARFVNANTAPSYAIANYGGGLFFAQ